MSSLLAMSGFEASGELYDRRAPLVRSIDNANATKTAQKKLAPLPKEESFSPLRRNKKKAKVPWPENTLTKEEKDSNMRPQSIADVLNPPSESANRTNAIRSMLDETDNRLLQAAEALRGAASGKIAAGDENKRLDDLVHDAVEKETMLWDGVMSTIAREVYSWDHEKAVLLERIRRRMFQLIHFFKAFARLATWY